MKLVLLFGDAAVGKMTVGRELAKITGLRLNHNHMTIEPILEIFGDFNKPALFGTRDVIFKEFAKTDKYGMIFTFMWAFDSEKDWQATEHIANIFRRRGAEIYYVELDADQDERMRRNVTEDRIKAKPSKRDIEASNARILRDDAEHRFVSYEGEIKYKNYMRIDNTHLEPQVVAKMIKDRFSL